VPKNWFRKWCLETDLTVKKQIFSYILVGILNTFFGYSIYALLIFSGLSYIYSIITSTIVGVIFNFKTISKYVFKSSDNSLIKKFILVYIFGLIANICLIRLFNSLNLNFYIAGFLSIIVVAVVSFVLMKFFVFKNKVYL